MVGLTGLRAAQRIVLGLLALAPGTGRAAVVYVDQSATGSNDGTSWANAHTSLQTALGLAASGDEVWVANGVYKPTDINGPRTATFQLESGVALYGGFQGGDSTSFPGGETQLGQRNLDPLTNGTVLSGDRGGNDVGDVNDPSREENSFHVLTGSGTNGTARLDGFTITGGFGSFEAGGIVNIGGSPTLSNCNFSGNSGGDGGGMHNDGSSPALSNCTFTGNLANKSGGGVFNVNNSRPTVTNCRFSGNSAQRGGGMHSRSSTPTLRDCSFTGNSAILNGGGMDSTENSSPMLTDCSFTGNSAGVDGGGMHNESSSPTLTHCSFRDNSAARGAGMYIAGGIPTLTHCDFIGNSASSSGGGMFNEGSAPTLTNCSFIGNSAKSRGGGMTNGIDSPTLSNCSFSGNAATDGGGMFNNGGSPSLSNCSFSGNSATGEAGGLLSLSGNPTLRSCILWSNTGEQIERSDLDVTYSLVEGGYVGTGNIDGDPLFVDPDGPDDIVGTPDDDLRLLPGSPAVDAGDNTALPADTADLDEDGDIDEPLSRDLVGSTRQTDDPSQTDTGAGPAPIVDMGAHELQDARLGFALPSRRVLEDAGPALVSVQLTTVSGLPIRAEVRILIASSDGTAVAQQDYLPVSSAILFPAGSPSGALHTVAIPLVDDSLTEPDESFSLSLSAPSGATLGEGALHTVTIEDDDAPLLSINDVTVTEGNAGTVDATFTLSLSSASAQTVTVTAVALGLTAQPTADYEPAMQLVSFTPGVVEQSFVVQVRGDVLDEPDESFFVLLLSPEGAVLGKGIGIGAITDDDAPIAVSVGNTLVTEIAGIMAALLTVSLWGMAARRRRQQAAQAATSDEQRRAMSGEQ